MTDPTASHVPDDATVSMPEAEFPLMDPNGEPSRLGPYRLVSRLAAGGMGAVFAAEDATLHRPAAVKVMRDRFAANPSARQQFLQEARAAAAVRNDHIVTVYHAGEDAGILYIAFEMLHGQTLGHWMKDAGRPDSIEVVRIGRELAVGLEAAHGANLIHRDIKPSNVWLEGPHRRAKLLDFGLAALVLPAVPFDGERSLSGTPSYMSPEQAEGRPLDHRTDLFSLGIVLYELAAGQRPFAGATIPELLASIGACRPVPVRVADPTVPAGLAEIIDQLLRKEPAERPPSAANLRDRLRTVEIDLRARVAVTRTGLTRDGEEVVRTDVSEPAADGTAVARVLVAASRTGQPAKRKKRWLTVLVMFGTLPLLYFALSSFMLMESGAPESRDVAFYRPADAARVPERPKSIDLPKGDSPDAMLLPPTSVPAPQVPPAEPPTPTPSGPVSPSTTVNVVPAPRTEGEFAHRFVIRGAAMRNGWLILTPAPGSGPQFQVVIPPDAVRVVLPATVLAERDLVGSPVEVRGQAVVSGDLILIVVERRDQFRLLIEP